MLPIDSDFPKEGVKSETSPSIHKLPAQYLAEIIMLFKYEQLKEVTYFWREPQYRMEYTGNVMRLQSRLKYCDFKYVNNAIVKNKLTSTSMPMDALIIEELQNATPTKEE